MKILRELIAVMYIFIYLKAFFRVKGNLKVSFKF